MAMTEEEQMQAMLDAMGASSIEELAAPPASGKPGGQSVSSSAAVSSAVPDPFDAFKDGAKLAAENLVSIRAAAPSARRPAIAVNTLVHLLGLGTSSQLDVVEGKLDLLTLKLNAVTLKLDRLTNEVALIKCDAAVDRIDFQLDDIRALLKRTLGGEGTPARKQISPVPGARTDDASFQTAEGNRMRESKR